jgi:hypothetical protein
MIAITPSLNASSLFFVIFDSPGKTVSEIFYSRYPAACFPWFPME